jgi:hypothetical protein
MKRFYFSIAISALSLLVAAGVIGAQQAKPATRPAAQSQTGKLVKFPSPPKTVARVASFAGTWKGTYSSNLVEPMKVTLIFQQFGSTVTGTYLSANGAQGVMSGVLQAGGTATLQATQITPTCPGKFDMPATVNGHSMTWKFIGQDCLGQENGSGKATKQ